MSLLLPPTGSDWKVWANQLVNQLNSATANRVPTDPRPVQLAYIQAGEVASQNGILMWDETTQTVKVSKAGAYVNV